MLATLMIDLLLHLPQDHYCQPIVSKAILNAINGCDGPDQAAQHKKQRIVSLGDKETQI